MDKITNHIAIKVELHISVHCDNLANIEPNLSCQDEAHYHSHALCQRKVGRRCATNSTHIGKFANHRQTNEISLFKIFLHLRRNLVID